MKKLRDVSATLGVTLQPLEVRDADDFEGVFATATRQGAGALLVLREALFTSHRTRIVELAAKHRLPAMYGVRDFVNAGGLMSYGVNLPDMLRRLAIYVDRILKGAKPADLPVEQPTKFELLVNQKNSEGTGR